MHLQAILKRVHITDFKCIRDLELNFYPTVNVLYGRNGVGKTSVLDAIYTAFSADSYDKELIRYGTSGSVIEVEFTLGKETYFLQKSLRKVKGTAAILETPQGRIRGIKNIVAYLKDLGIGKVSPSWWYVTQASIALLIHHLGTMTSRNKVLNFVETLFGLTPLDDFHELYYKWRGIVSITTERDKELTYSTRLEDARAQLQSFLQILSCEELVSKYNRIRDALTTIEAQIQVPEVKIHIAHQRYKDIRQDIETNEQILEQLKREEQATIQQLRELFSPYAKYIPSDVKEISQEGINAIAKRLQLSYQAKIETQKILRKAVELFRNRPNYPQNARWIRSKYEDLRKELLRYQKVLENLDACREDICPTCHQAISPEHRSHIFSQYQRLEAEKNKWEPLYKELVDIAQKRIDIRQQFRILRKRFKELVLQTLDVSATHEEILNWANQAVKLCNAYEDVKQKIRDTEDKLRRAKAQASVVEEIVSNHPDVPLTFDPYELFEKREQLRKELNQIEPEYQQYQYAKKSVDELKTKIQELEGKLQEVKYRQRIHEETNTFINDFRMVFTECSLQFIRDYLIQVINEYLLKSDCGFVIELRENPFGFVAKFLNGAVIPLDYLSFGQKVFVSLLFLLTLHKLLPVQQFLLLDEPLIGLDSGNRSAFVELMEKYNGSVIIATASSPFGNRIEISG